MSNAILLAPGPVQLHPTVQKILAEPMIHHRTPLFDAILGRVLKNIKLIFQTKNHVFIHTSTGSGAMESALVNLLSPNDEVLAIVSGKFGERWADMAEVFGAKVHRMNILWGKAVQTSDVENFLQKNKNIKLVLCQACETSTGVAHDIQSLGKMICQTPALFVVDGITAVGAYDIKMDDWQIDVLIAGSQKAVMLPTGLSFISLSEKAWKLCEEAKTARFYFDLRKELKANKNGETLFSTAVPMIKALDYILSQIQELGLEKHFSEIKRRAEFTRQMALKMNLELYSDAPSDSVTALKLPTQIIQQKRGAEFREHLEKEYQVTLMGGQDEAKGKIIRIGHMGYIQDADLLNTVLYLAKSLNDFSCLVDVEQIKSHSEKWLTDNPL